MRARHSTRIRAGLYAGVALATLIAAPSFADDAAATAGADQTAVLAQGAATAAAAPAAPADSAPSTVKEITVTGIRKSIQDSIGVKKSAEAIVEAVSAEEIGKLPDNSIAESIARLPGLTAQRLDGRAQVISIRGMGPDFSTALLNGREQVTTGDNRGVEFDQYPAELLSGVEVYKTPTAELLGQGLAGTVDLQTIRPLAYGHRTFAVNARGEMDQLGALNAGTSSQGWRGTASYIDQSSDGRFGVTLGLAYMDSPSQAERFNSWGYPTVGGAYAIGGQKSYVQSEDLKRTGALATFEFKPIPTLHSTIDVYYTRFDDLQIQRGIEMPMVWGGLPLNPGYTVSGNMVTQGEFDGVKGVVRNDGNKRRANLKSIGWNTEWKFADKWSAMADLSYSDVYRVDQVLETYSGTGPAGVGATDNVGFREVGDGAGFVFSHVLDYADPNLIQLTAPQGWGNNIVAPYGQVGYLNQPHIYDQLASIRGQIKREFEGPISSIELGFNYSQRHKKYIADEWFLGLAGNPASMPIPSKYLLSPTSLGYLGLGSMVSYDPFALIGDPNVITRSRNPDGDVETKNWRVGENVLTTYLMGNIKTALGPIPVSGNVGVQIVQTDQTSSGFAVNGSGANPAEVAVSGGASYTEPLPSLNLTFHLADDQLLRFAAARTLARARMDQMSASQSFSYNAVQDTNGNYWSGGGGNPALRPWIADAVDLSFEKYFGGRKGYISAAVFYKNLENYVWTNNSSYNYAGFPCGCGTPLGTTGTYSTPENRNGGTIYGAEFAFSIPLSMVHPWLDGFGILGSVSDTESSINPGQGVGVITLPGLSKTVANATFYYEKNGWQFRISNRYRSKFLGEVAGFGDSRTFRQVAEENVTDAQFGYEFKQGPMRNLSVLFQINNLTDEPFSTYQNGDPRQVIDYQRYGPTYLFGINWKM